MMITNSGKRIQMVVSFFTEREREREKRDTVPSQKGENPEEEEK